MAWLFLVVAGVDEVTGVDECGFVRCFFPPKNRAERPVLRFGWQALQRKAPVGDYCPHLWLLGFWLSTCCL